MLNMVCSGLLISVSNCLLLTYVLYSLTISHLPHGQI